MRKNIISTKVSTLHTFPFFSMRYTMTPEERVEFIRQLIEEGPHEEGDKCPLIPPSEIPWINNDLLQKGLQFSRNNTYAIFIANLLALFSGFSVKPETLVITRSQRFCDPIGSFKRVLSTAQRLGNWFSDGIFDENSVGFKNVKIVRRMHAIYKKSNAKLPTPEQLGWTPEVTHLRKLVNEQLNGFDLSAAPMHLLTWTPPNPFSQFDLSITHFLGFTSFLFLFPQGVGTSRGAGNRRRNCGIPTPLCCHSKTSWVRGSIQFGSSSGQDFVQGNI